MQMDIYEFLGLLIEDDETIAIYDMTSGEEVFCGEASEAIFCDYSDCEVLSFDLCHDDKRGVRMILNIETEEE